mgnify:CR=1 FL=1
MAHLILPFIIVLQLSMVGCAQIKDLRKEKPQDVEDRTVDEQLSALLDNGGLELIFSEDFEDNTFLDQGKCSGNCPEIMVDNDDNRFMRASLSGSMKPGYRTELSFGKPPKLTLRDKTYLLYFKVRFLPDSGGIFPKSMFVQIHALKTKQQKEDKTLKAWQSFNGRILSGVRSGYWEGEKVNGKQLRSDFTIEHDEWFECLVVIRLSDGPDGQLTTYRDGSKEFEALGRNSADWMTSQYLKMGVYSAHNSGRKAKYGEPSMAYRRTDFDDVSLYTISSTLAEPGTYFNLEDIVDMH